MLLSKPIPPLSRVIKEGRFTFCKLCKSTTSRKGFLGLFGKLLCDNKNCKNSI